MDKYTSIRNYIDSLPDPTPENPLHILVSSCLSGTLCGFDGTSYGEYPIMIKLLAHKNLAFHSFCPEDFSFGTPRELCNIHGGDGFDVLAGKAKVLTESGKDWTAQLIHAAERMLAVATQHQVRLAILTDTSASCGSQVIYNGHRHAEDPKYLSGPGVCSALLIRNGFHVISQRDYRTLEHFFKKLNPSHIISEQSIDYHESSWYKDHFADKPGKD
jgi:uncharacterized protein YbbK (DUF523 family)